MLMRKPLNQHAGFLWCPSLMLQTPKCWFSEPVVWSEGCHVCSHQGTGTDTTVTVHHPIFDRQRREFTNNPLSRFIDFSPNSFLVLTGRTLFNQARWVFSLDRSMKEASMGFSRMTFTNESKWIIIKRVVVYLLDAMHDSKSLTTDLQTRIYQQLGLLQSVYWSWEIVYVRGEILCSRLAPTGRKS